MCSQVGPKGALRRARFGLSAVASSLLSKFGIGEPPLQTLLTTSLEPFSDIRRRRDGTFGKFPSAADFAEMREKATAPMAPRDGRKTVRYLRNPWDPPEAEEYYEVRFSPPRDFTYEGLASTAAKAEAGVTTTHRCSSLFEANALARRVLSRMPTLAIATFKVSSDSVRLLDAAARAPVADATDEWVGDFTDVVKNAAAAPVAGSAPVSTDDDRQAVWDDMLQVIIRVLGAFRLRVVRPRGNDSPSHAGPRRARSRRGAHGRRRAVVRLLKIAPGHKRDRRCYDWRCRRARALPALQRQGRARHVREGIELRVVRRAGICRRISCDS